VAETVRRGLVLLLVAFFLYWALSQPTQFAEAVATLAQSIGDLLAAIGQILDSLLRRLL
jgi:cyanate permease